MAATTGAQRTTTSGGSTSAAPTTIAASTRIPTVCDTLTDEPQTERVEWRAPGPDEVGGHQRLAVARRQGVTSAQERGRRE